MTIKMKARELGLDDLRHDVEVLQLMGVNEGRRRVVGQLQAIEGPYTEVERSMLVDRVMLRIGPAAMPLDTVVDANSEVTVDREPRRPTIGHWGSGVLPA